MTHTIQCGPKDRKWNRSRHLLKPGTPERRNTGTPEHPKMEIRIPKNHNFCFNQKSIELKTILNVLWSNISTENNARRPLVTILGPRITASFAGTDVLSRTETSRHSSSSLEKMAGSGCWSVGKLLNLELTFHNYLNRFRKILKFLTSITAL